MKKFLSQLFNDNNSINEKSVVGFLVLGSFGIGSVDKWINKGKSDVTEE